jgi:hypothetical protein
VATVTHTTDANTMQADGFVCTWPAIGNGSQGDAAGGPWVTAYFVVTGTFGAGGSIRLEGSDDAVNWNILSPPSLTAAGSFVLQLTEHPKFLRPNVTAGDGTTALTVVGFFTAPRRAF